MKRMDTQKGFTLVEIMIVVALIAIMASFAIPAFQNYTTNSNTKTVAREIMADIINTRQRAIEENLNAYRITYDTGTNNYALSRTDTGATLWTKNLSQFSGRNKLQSVNFGGGAFIGFQRRGTITGGNVVVQNEINSTATITTQITGRTYVRYSMQH